MGNCSVSKEQRKLQRVQQLEDMGFNKCKTVNYIYAYIFQVGVTISTFQLILATFRNFTYLSILSTKAYLMMRIVSNFELKMLVLIHSDLSMMVEGERFMSNSSFFKLFDVPVRYFFNSLGSHWDEDVPMVLQKYCQR